MRRSVRWTLVIPLLLVMATACLLPGGRTASTSRTIDAAHGGELRAPHGIVLDVPPHVLTADGSASITDVGQGEYDIHIAVPWTGSVNVTVPISGDQDAVVHSVGGWWVAEGTGPGQARVSVTQLSVFSTLSGLAKKGVDAACLTWDPTAFVNCLALKGVQYVNSSPCGSRARSATAARHIWSRAP